VSERDGVMVISSDTAIKGAIRNCRRLEIFGYVEGEVTSGELIVHDGGNFYGKAKTGSADVSGTVQGDVVVDGLIRIHSTGIVSGNVHYGRLAMETGALLSAEVRNVPPRLMGDMQVSVLRGRSARITTEDINAVDPDDTAANLIFHVSNEAHGMIRVTGAPSGPVQTFSQADLAGGRVLFLHDGSSQEWASFDVMITDRSGAGSGAPQTVRVSVMAA
jgi:cytoskeletal protein CcmA (bactofilin family)